MLMYWSEHTKRKNDFKSQQGQYPYKDNSSLYVKVKWELELDVEDWHSVCVTSKKPQAMEGIWFEKCLFPHSCH